MIKKKVSVKSKDHDSPEPAAQRAQSPKPVRGRPKSRLVDNDILQKLPSSRVFTVSIENKTTCISRSNNIIRLKLKISNINKLERYIVDNKGLLDDVVNWQPSSQQTQWQPLMEIDDATNLSLTKANATVSVSASTASTAAGSTSSFGASSVTQASAVSSTGPSYKGLESFIKMRSVVPQTAASDTPSALAVNRKDLIINSGIKRTSQEPLQVFSDSWPMTSPYACWYCCHSFDNTPVGIPAILTNYVFRCYGNFCSYNCAKRYLCPLKDDEDDMASMQSSNDIFKGDDQGEKLQLLELLYHLETDADMDEPIKTAPRRLILKMFGGTKTIDEFRKSFKTNTTYHTFKMPLASMAYHMEECVDTKSDARRKFKNMSLDVARLEQAYEELMRERKRNSRVTIQKILSFGNGIDPDEMSL
jgi:hypothetical protein